MVKRTTVRDSTIFSVLVDDILEQQKVVIKEMGPVFRNTGFAEGAAIMGDGNVCLVLDLAGLAEEARKSEVKKMQPM